MRTVFLGTSQFAAAVLRRLAASDHRPLLALTRPDRPAGRGRRPQAPPLAVAARDLGMELAQPVSVNDPPTRKLIADVRPDAVVVCAFGALINEPLLSEHNLLNVHPSLLPRWRGAAPVERAIMAGDEQTGVSIMRLTAGLDSGPVCLAQREPIRLDDTYGSLAARLQEVGAKLLVQTLGALERGEALPFAEQDEQGATYAEKITARDRLLDPSRPAVELERVVRSLHPHVGARVQLADGSLLGVSRARVASDGALVGETFAEVKSPVETLADAQPAREALADVVLPSGTLAASDGRLLYGTARCALELLEVQPPGGRSMDAASYLRGHAV